MKSGLLLSVVGLSMLILGCGGGTTPSAPPPVSAPPPAPPAAVPRPTQAVTQKKKTTEKVPEPPQEWTTRDWAIQPPPGNFEVASLEESQAQSAIYAVAPVSGANSGSLEAFAPAVESGSASPIASLPAGFTAVPGSVSPEGWPERIRCDKDGMLMVYVPAQVTRVGSNQGPPDTQPEHPAFVSAFYIDLHEVPLSFYLKYREQIRLEKKNLLAAPTNENGQPLEPVLGVSWRDAESYSKAMGRELPTEAEWEAAARGETGFTYPWGEGRPIWSRERRVGQIDAVASFHTDSSPFGILDLAGNAREWTADWYQADAFQNALEKDGSPRRDWTGPARSEPIGHRVIKGSATGWELWARGHGTLAQGLPDVGFRCVLRLGSGTVEKKAVQ